MKKIFYHVVTERPMKLGQIINYDENNHSGVYQRVYKIKDKVDEIYSNPEKYKNIALDHHTKVALRELAMEEVRIKKYPEYPSRLSSLYVSNTLEEALKWYNIFINMNRPVYQIVKVEVKGKYFTGDAFNCFDGTIDKEENLRLAENYWKNVPNSKEENPIYETLVSGPIKVIEIVKEF